MLSAVLSMSTLDEWDELSYLMCEYRLVLQKSQTRLNSQKALRQSHRNVTDLCIWLGSWLHELGVCNPGSQINSNKKEIRNYVCNFFLTLDQYYYYYLDQYYFKLYADDPTISR